MKRTITDGKNGICNLCQKDLKRDIKHGLTPRGETSHELIYKCNDYHCQGWATMEKEDIKTA